MKKRPLLKAIVICLLVVQSCNYRKDNNSQITNNKITIQTQKNLEAMNKRLSTIKDCIICDSAQIFKTMEDILKMDRFKNKVVYLDFWGTGCSPCLEEFKHTPELKKKFHKEPIEYLYITTYEKEKKWDSYTEMKWRMIIERYKLTGTNLRVSNNLLLRFINKYKDQTDPKKLHAVPKYILFDKKGEVVDFDAPRPSDNEVLYEMIQELLNVE